METPSPESLVFTVTLVYCPEFSPTFLWLNTHFLSRNGVWLPSCVLADRVSGMEELLLHLLALPLHLVHGSFVLVELWRARAHPRAIGTPGKCTRYVNYIKNYNYSPSHLIGFSPVCFRMWTCSPSSEHSPFPHSWHSYFGAPWVAMCFFRFAAVELDFWQISHLYLQIKGFGIKSENCFPWI